MLAMPHPTHMFELYRIIKAATRGDITFGECHYTADSFVAEMTDPYDGQQYRLTIEPVRGK